MNRQPDSIAAKILDPGNLGVRLSDDFRALNTIVFTNGCFDILHPGHRHLLKLAKKMGSQLVVGLNSDDSVKRLKGNSRPINTEEERAYTLASIEYVDFIVLFAEDTPENLIQIIRPDILVKGGDYKKDEIVGSDFVRSYGGRVATIPILEGHSTTKLVDKIKKD